MLFRMSPPPGGGRHGGGGDGEDGGGATPARAFATGYRPHSGDLMVYGGAVVTLVGALAAFVNANPGFLVASLAGSLSALYFWPTVDMRRPQLGANAEGLYVARIGIIAWPAVRSLRVRRRAVRTMNLATLVVELDPPLPGALIAPEEVPLSQRLTAGNARTDGRTVEVMLHTLAMPADAIEARLLALKAVADGGSA